MFVEFNTFQKHSTESKLSANIYLMSVAAVFLVKVKLVTITS